MSSQKKTDLVDEAKKLIAALQSFVEAHDLMEHEDEEEWKYFEPLFKWLDISTDHWGDDLVALLANLGGIPRDKFLPPELKDVWDDFGKLDEDTRWDYADAYARATGWDGTSYYLD